MDTSVLIVGGGPVGLTLALTFAKFGVRCSVVERATDTTRHPKMDITNGRSMEIFRMLGVADAIYDAAVPAHICHDVSWVTSLVGHEIYRFRYPGPAEARQNYKQLNDGTLAMEPDVRISQLVVEPLLRDAALASPYVTVRYGCEFVEFQQDANRVISRVKNADTGETETIRSSYLAGCDGGNSRVRNQMGIGLSGEANIRTRYSIHFASRDKTKFEPWGPAWHYQSPIHGTLVAQDGIERYTLHSFLDHGETAESVDPYDKVKAFVGVDFDFQLLRALEWQNNLLVADRYREGRVLLAGDATHQYIPTGGYGMNTGIGDAFDLGWKLSALIQGWGGVRLLDSVQEERRPVAIRNREGSKRHAGARLAIGKVWTSNLDDPGPGGENARAELAGKIKEIGNAENESRGIEHGYSYAGSSIICNETDDEFQDDPLNYTPTTTPGYRPPAIYLEDGTPIFAQFGAGFTLLDFGSSGSELFEKYAANSGIPLTRRIMADDHARNLYGYNLVLIRPDQHVSWRGNEVPDNLSSILERVSGN